MVNVISLSTKTPDSTAVFHMQDGETHAERLARLRQQPAANAKPTNSQKRRQKRKAKAQIKQSQPAQKPGKRQRAELKAQIFKQAASKPTKDAKAALKQQVKPSSRT